MYEFKTRLLDESTKSMTMTQNLNSDLLKRAVMDTTGMDWQASPSPTVWRKRLDLVGGAESGRVTSVVRYDPDSAFPTHEHPEGEEIFVLEGIFSDEYGDYPAGSYLLNPEGFRHAPFSKDGCVIFVKLRQYGGASREQVAINTKDIPWSSGPIPGVELKPLYAHPDHPERMQIERWNPGSVWERHAHSSGKEILVLEGVLEDEYGHYPVGTWLRNPPGSVHTSFSKEGCVLYVKTGGLPF